MANWLSAKMFRRSSSAEPQAYELPCSCGRVIGGVRAETYQQITCPGCRQRLFVLPASVYPRPKPVKARPNRRPRPAPAPDVDSTEIADERPVKRSAPKAAPRPWPKVTPLRVAAVAILVAATGMFWAIDRSQRLRQAEADYALAVQQGREALQRNDLAAAAGHYAIAARAVETLGSDDPAARTTRQLFNETRASVNLADKSPQDLVAEAIQMHAAGDTGWEQTFQYSYRDSWMILDAPVVLESDGDLTVLRIDYPLSTRDGTSSAVFDVDSAVLRSLATSTPKRMIFAAQLDGMRLDPKDSRVWRIALNGTTAFPWSSQEVWGTLLGQPVDPPTRHILASQSEAMQIGVAPREVP